MLTQPYESVKVAEAVDYLRKLDQITQGELRQLEELMKIEPQDRTLGDLSTLLMLYRKYAPDKHQTMRFPEIRPGGVGGDLTRMTHCKGTRPD